MLYVCLYLFTLSRKNKHLDLKNLCLKNCRTVVKIKNYITQQWVVAISLNLNRLYRFIN